MKRHVQARVVGIQHALDSSELSGTLDLRLQNNTGHPFSTRKECTDLIEKDKLPFTKTKEIEYTCQRCKYRTLANGNAELRPGCPRAKQAKNAFSCRSPPDLTWITDRFLFNQQGFRHTNARGARQSSCVLLVVHRAQVHHAGCW